MRPRDPHEPGRTASSLELFFDLVFVFALTQLAETLAERLSWAAAGNTAMQSLLRSMTPEQRAELQAMTDEERKRWYRTDEGSIFFGVLQDLWREDLDEVILRAYESAGRGLRG